MKNKFADMNWVLLRLRKLSRYLLLVLVLPGGSLLALLLWLYQRSHKPV